MTRIRRIITAATPTNWARFFQSNLPLIDQPEIRLVDERCGLQGVVAALAAQIRACQPSQLAVDERQDLVASLRVLPDRGRAAVP